MQRRIMPSSFALRAAADKSADPPHALGIRMFTLAGWMLDSENDNFLGLIVSSVIDEIRISPRHQLAHALDLLLPSNMRKQNQTLQRFKNRGAHAKPGLRAMSADMVGDLGEIPNRTRRETELHCSKRRNAASTSASVANWWRLACASPSSTAGRCAGSISSGSPS